MGDGGHREATAGDVGEGEAGRGGAQVLVLALTLDAVLWAESGSAGMNRQGEGNRKVVTI